MQVKLVLNGKTINLTGDNTIIKSTNFSVDKDGNMTAKSGKIAGWNINNSSLSCKYTSNSSNLMLDLNGFLGKVTLNGNGFFQIVDRSNMGLFRILDENGNINQQSSNLIRLSYGNYVTEIGPTYVSSLSISQTSLAEHKKNFEKMQDNALEIIKNIDIYKYNLKNEKDTDKKHIGFVIGDNYNYSKEVTSIDNQGVDNYSFTSLCCKAIQEEQKQIEKLKEKDKQNEEIIANLIERIETLEKEVKDANS